MEVQYEAEPEPCETNLSNTPGHPQCQNLVACETWGRQEQMRQSPIPCIAPESPEMEGFPIQDMYQMLALGTVTLQNHNENRMVFEDSQLFEH